MTEETVIKLYEHFVRGADVNKYHGNLAVLSGLLRVSESSLRDALTTLGQQYAVTIYWFTHFDFIADLTELDRNN